MGQAHSDSIEAAESCPEAADVLHLLLVEESGADAKLIADVLDREGYAVRWRRVRKLVELECALDEKRWDAVISGCRLPGFGWLAVLRAVQSKHRDVPVLLLSGFNGEEIAVQALKAGASDCVSRSNLGRLVPALERAMEDARLREEHRAFQKQLAASEQRFRTLFEADPLPMLVYDSETLRFLDVNPAACRNYGYTHAEFLRMGLRDIRPADELPRFEQWMRNRRLASRNAGVWRHRLKDGSVIHVEIHTRDGEYLGRSARFVTPIDVTERMRAEAGLRKLSLVVQQSPAATVITDTKGRIEYVNPKFAESSGYAPEELIGRTPAVVKSGLTPPEVYADLWSTIRSGATWRGALRNRRRDGTLYWEDTWISPLMDGAGAIVNYIAVKEDITARIQAEEELFLLNGELEQRIAERTTELEAANRELEAFSSSVSHDLRAPLTSIQRFAEALWESSATVLDDTSRRYLERIRGAGQRMEDLIEDLLGLSRITRAAFVSGKVDLSALATEVLAEARDADPGRSCELVVHPGMRTCGDRPLLRIALTNLVGNAWKFSSRRDVVEIEVGQVAAGEGEATFFVRDRGAGFDPALAEQIFAPFRRLHSQSEFPGTGIGLAIVRRVIERHGGAIRAEGAVDVGATFWITLPQKPRC